VDFCNIPGKYYESLTIDFTWRDDFSWGGAAAALSCYTWAGKIFEIIQVPGEWPWSYLMLVMWHGLLLVSTQYQTWGLDSLWQKKPVRGG
jgi:hypothetical protein